MRKINLFWPALLLCSTVAMGQTETMETSSDFATRTSVGVDWKITKGLHLDAAYELRTVDKLARIERHQLDVGIQYSPVKHFDIGAGYVFIGHYDSEKVYKPRHRAYVDLTGSYKFGDWKLSLRERLQLTHKAYDVNPYQQTPNLLELKSRLKLAYKGFDALEPYVYAEVRHCLNGPSFTADYDEVSERYINYQSTGYSDAYLNRSRGAVGLKWAITDNHAVDFRLLADRYREKVIDTNAEGTKLKSYSWEQTWVTSLAVSYLYSF